LNGTATEASGSGSVTFQYEDIRCYYKINISAKFIDGQIWIKSSHPETYPYQIYNNECPKLKDVNINNYTHPKPYKFIKE
jgi:hypothetical protein